MQSPSLESVNSQARHEIVRAGAGAGKTYTLTHRVMDIAEEHLRLHNKLPRLIVTTFTRKATQELRERLMLLALEEKPHLVDFVTSRSFLVVSTIHGVMDLYLKRYGANICIDPSYKIIGGADAGKLARQALRQVLLGDEATGDLLEVFQFNRLVALCRRLDSLWAERPDAGPFRLAEIESLFKLRAQEIAKNLKESAEIIRGESNKADWLAMADDYDRLAALLESGDWPKTRLPFLAALDNMKTARKSAKGQMVISVETEEITRHARESAKELKDVLYDPEAWALFSERFETIEAVAKRFSELFRKAKLDAGLLEISDLEYQAMACIRSHPATVEAFWKEWDHWLIDEYQDTSPFQVELLRQLSGESPSFVVGDPQQSIYLFRGARSEVFREKEDEIVSSGGKQRLLSVNRRSKPELLLFLNDFFTRFEPPFQPMEPFLKEGEAIDPSRCVATFYIADSEESAKASEEVEEAEAAPADEEEQGSQEMLAIVAHVQGLIDNGAKPEDICVLARTNKVLAEVATILADYRLPTHVHAAAGFFDRRETLDALALLRFLVNPHDNVNTVELVRSSWFKIPDRVLATFTRPRPESVWEKLTAEPSMADELEAVARLNRLLQETAVSGLSETFKRGLIEAGFLDLSHRHDVSGRRESNIWKLLWRLQQEECKPGFNALAFISGSYSDLKLDEAGGEGDAVAAVEPDRINLMTVHASKGLEFRHVILPRMDQKPNLTMSEEFTFDEVNGRWALRVPYGEDKEFAGSLPEALWLEKFRAHELEEHARVLYVALTRAVESIFMSWTPSVQRNSWADMVRLDLAPGVHQGESFTYQVTGGDILPRQAVTEEQQAIIPRAKWQEPKALEGPLQIQEGTENRKQMSVSQMLDRKAGLHFVAGTDRQVTQLLKVASEGSAVHRLMELLKYPSRDRLGMLVKKWFPHQEDKVLGGIEFVRGCQAPPLMEIIGNGEVEWGFAIVEDGLVIEGQVDLWGRTDAGEAWIIDYKTGNPENRGKAFEQMGLYALALRKSGLLDPGEPLRLAAVYPFAEQIYIQGEPSRAQIRARFGLE